MRFWTETEYKDDRGAIIIQRHYFDDERDEPQSEVFLGKGMVMLQTPMGEIPHEFEVELEAVNITEAFQVFETQMNEKAPAIAEESAQKVIAEIQDQMKEKSQSIITPDQMRQAAAFDPNIRG